MPWSGSAELIRLDDVRATHSQSPPQPGNFVEVRGRRWLVEEVEASQPSIASLSCIDNMRDPGAFAAGAEEQQGGEPPPLAGAGVVVCLMA